MSEKKGDNGSRQEPIRMKDLALLRYALGINYADLRYLLGGTAATIAQGKHNDRILSPTLGILVRMLWNNPEDNPLPPAPDFDKIRKRFAGYIGSSKNQNMMPKIHAAAMLGTRRAAGSEWSQGGHQPSPQIRRLFWLLDMLAEKYGEEEAWRRWHQAVDEEAKARGSNFDELIQTGTWKRAPGESSFQSAESEDEDEE